MQIPGPAPDLQRLGRGYGGAALPSVLIGKEPSGGLRCLRITVLGPQKENLIPSLQGAFHCLNIFILGFTVPNTILSHPQLVLIYPVFLASGHPYLHHVTFCLKEGLLALCQGS